MTIHQIVEQALQDGYLTPSMEAEVGRICESAIELSTEEYMALDRLMGALLTGEITAMPVKKFMNVMEELVIREATTCLKDLDNSKESMPDLGDVAAYALNRLPPLYATSKEGAHFQRQRATNELLDLIRQQVQEGIKRYIERPILPHHELDELELSGESQTTGHQDLVMQMNRLLRSFASD
ncbi:MAG: late competence development ComFB family protein [Microcystaceae cyanobacterium]